MLGVCLHPGKSLVELKVRVYNRTPFTETFFWSNVVVRVHEKSVAFPSEVFYVADHVWRAMSQYPLCGDHYYGVDDKGRAQNGVPPAFEHRAFRLSWTGNALALLGTRT